MAECVCDTGVLYHELTVDAMDGHQVARVLRVPVPDEYHRARRHEVELGEVVDRVVPFRKDKGLPPLIANGEQHYFRLHIKGQIVAPGHPGHLLGHRLAAFRCLVHVECLVTGNGGVVRDRVANCVSFKRIVLCQVLFHSLRVAGQGGHAESRHAKVVHVHTKGCFSTRSETSKF
eukprot:5415276-Prymnesium_polylepis.2